MKSKTASGLVETIKQQTHFIEGMISGLNLLKEENSKLIAELKRQNPRGKKSL
jgi:hypothetical protein